MNENSTASTLRRHEKYDRLIAAAKGKQAVATAVAHPCDETSLRGAVEAGEAGLIKPILVGPKEKIAAVAKEFSLDLGGIEIVDVPHSQAAAEKAVELVRTGKADLLMKGSLHTDELLSAVMKRETGLRTGRRVSHVFVMDVPGHAQTLFITDAAVNIAPDLVSKRDIIQNAIDLYAGLGLGTPKVAILSAVETVTPTIPSTIEAAALCKMADRGQITGGELDGPLAFDNAISPEAARIKGIKSPVAGQAQILVVPDLEAGNMLAKNLTFLSHADAAGIVLGARVPIILTSRADHVRTRLASCAVAALYRHSQMAKQPIRGLKPMSETILVVNAGSSSIKFQLFSVGAGDRLQCLLKGQIEGIGVHPHLVAKGEKGDVLIDKTWPVAEAGDVPAALNKVVEFLRAEIGSLPVAVGHRVVHGGPDYSTPILIDDAVVERLQAFSPLAPLHQPNNLGPIRTLLQRQPQLPQVACFDTAFHRGHPEIADRYALPERFYQEGVRRYGFHGLSYEYIASRLPELAPDIAQGRVVVAHLGSGASMCAINACKSVESTMGFTALDGLPMGTRPGQLDAGIVLYLLTEKGMSAREIEYLFYYDCGLKGLSGISNDVRDLLTNSDPRAKLTLDYFVYRIALFTGMLAAAMSGIDGFVFTAGVGENAPAIREALARRLSWLGLELDAEANTMGSGRISSQQSRVACYVIPTDEELMIARHTLRVLGARPAFQLKEKSA